MAQQCHLKVYKVRSVSQIVWMENCTLRLKWLLWAWLPIRRSTTDGWGRGGSAATFRANRVRGAILTYLIFQQRCGRIHSLMAKFSCFQQGLAAAFGHFGLAAGGSSLILFAQFFSPLVWNQGWSNEPALLYCQVESLFDSSLFLLGKHQQGFQHRLFCSLSFPLVQKRLHKALLFPSSLGFQRKIGVESKLTIFIQCYQY